MARTRAAALDDRLPGPMVFRAVTPRTHPHAATARVRAPPSPNRMPPLKNSVADHLVKTAQATHAGRDVFELASLLLTQLSARGTWPATWRPEPLAAALVYGAARLNGTVELTQDLAACAAGTSATTLRRYLALLAANLDVDFGLGSLQARPEDMLP